MLMWVVKYAYRLVVVYPVARKGSLLDVDNLTV